MSTCFTSINIKQLLIVQYVVVVKVAVVLSLSLSLSLFLLEDFKKECRPTFLPEAKLLEFAGS